MSNDMQQAFQAALTAHKQAVERLEASRGEDIQQITELVIDCLRNEGCVYLCGNGGSAADSQHVAGELVGRFHRNRRPLPAVAFTTDTSVLTCIGNDYSYQDIFTRQVDGMVTERDVLWAFSTSGSSANVVAAAELAREKGARVIAFTGKEDTPLEHLADACLCSGTTATSTAQEIHQLAYHIICELIDQEFALEG